MRLGDAAGRLTVVAEAPVSDEEQALREVRAGRLEGPEGEWRGEGHAVAALKVVLSVWLQIRQHHRVQHLQTQPLRVAAAWGLAHLSQPSCCCCNWHDKQQNV